MAFKTLLYGDTGTGKTCCIATLLLAGQKVRFLAAESNARTGILAGLDIWKVPQDLRQNLAIMIPNRPKRGFSKLLKNEEASLVKPLEVQMKSIDPEKKDYTRYLSVLKGTVDFVGEDKQSYGDVSTWEDDTTFVIDGMTIICEAIMQSILGGKLATTQPEWGVAQGKLKDFIRMLTEDTTCNLVMMAHPTKEIDPILGTQRIYPSNIGQALNPLIPTAFSDVIWTERNGKKFTWCTDHRLAVTRTSHLPIETAMEQDFRNFSNLKKESPAKKS
jgi:hypothetical protein